MTMEDHRKIKETVKNVFSRNAEKYVTSGTHAKGDDLDLLVEWLQPRPNWQALDIATGGGHVSKRLSPHVSQVFATDLTREMLAAARNHLRAGCDNVRFIVADAENLPFLDETFDAVTCRIAAHHFPDAAAFIREASRVLKPGGRLLLIDNIVPDDKRIDAFVNTLEKLRDESHGRCYSISEWSAWLAASNLSIKRDRTRKKTFEFPSWVRRTTRSEEQVRRVERHILEADDELKAYIGVVLADGQIVNIHIDEWMVLAEKPV